MAVALGRRAAAPAANPAAAASRAPSSAPPAHRHRSSPPPPRPPPSLLPLPDLVRLVRRPDGRGGRLPPGPRELALLTSQIMMGAGAGGAGEGAASASSTAAPTNWRRLYALFAEFSDVLNAVHVSALLTALPRAVDRDQQQQQQPEAAEIAAFSGELLELAGQLLPAGGAGARELVACACGCARLWGRSSSSSALTSPSSAARRLMQLVTARARPAFLSDAELAALGWAVAELGFPPPRTFVADYAAAARGRLAEMRPRELLQVGRALALMASVAAAEGAGAGAATVTADAAAAGVSSSSSSTSMVSSSWVEAFARACESRAPNMDARDVAGAMWAAAALARQAASAAVDGPSSPSSSSSSLPALVDALLLRAAEVADDLEDRHVATLLWACGAFATSPASFHAPTLLPLAWLRFEGRVLDGRWPRLLRRSAASPSHALRHAAVALVASARLGLGLTDVADAPSPFRAATLAAARAGLAAAAAYLAPPPAAAADEDDHAESSGHDSSSRSPSPDKKPRWAKPAPSALRDASSVLWALQRDQAARVDRWQPQQQDQHNVPPPDIPDDELTTARAAKGALAEALALRRRWRARARRRAAGRRFFRRDGLLRAPPLDVRPADLSVSLWSLARLGLLEPQAVEEEEEEEEGQAHEEEEASSASPRRPSRRRQLLRDAVAEASELLPLFGARETAGLLLALARARHRPGGGEAWGERAIVHFASLLPPAAAELSSGSGGGNNSSPSSSSRRRPPRPPAPRDLAGAIYGAGAALRRDASCGPAPLPPPEWALRRLAASSRAALPACGAPELVMLLRGFAGLRWHPGPAWAAAHARRCMEVAASGGGGGGGGRASSGGGGFSPRETAALQRAARRLYSVRPALLDSVEDD